MSSDIQTNTYGLTLNGFVIKPLSQILSELEAAAQGIWGPQVDLGPDGPVGQMIGNDALKIYNLWELVQAVYSSSSPNDAEGISLDRVAAIVAVKRNLAAATQVTVALYGTLGTVINFGHIVSQSATGNQFSLSAPVTIALTSLLTVTLTVSTVASGHVYSLTLNGNLLSYTASGSDTAATIAAALVAAINALGISTLTVTNLGGGTFTIAANDGLTSFSLTGLDSYITAANYASPGIYNCTVTGPIPAPAGSVNTINNPVTGLTSVTNPAAGAIGQNAESDAALRVRRYTAMMGGDATDIAIGAGLVNAGIGVTFAYCVSNRTLSPDSLERPAKSFEVQVIGGAQQAIANALWQLMPSGIQPYGNVGPLTVLDSSGNPQTVSFSRPIPQYIWLKFTVTADGSGTYPSNGGALIKSAVVVWAQANLPTVGGTIKLWPLAGPALAGIPGIESVSVTIAVTSTPTPPGSGAYTSVDAVLTTQQQAIFAVSQILVNGA